MAAFACVRARTAAAGLPGLFLVAIGLSFAAYLWINRYLLQSAFFTNEQAAAIVGFGALIGLFGSAMSVGRHLKRV